MIVLGCDDDDDEMVPVYLKKLKNKNFYLELVQKKKIKSIER